MEGNRRLAACLIITGDARAANEATRTAQFSNQWKKKGRPNIDPVPAIVFGRSKYEKAAILSYLGVRHIAGTQPWDSYAKAAWVARVVEQRGMTVAEVSTMIGDRHRTVNRLLEGYYLVRQLAADGAFRPEDSVRRGRGSVTEYPFSWVYTILGYKVVRDFLDLREGDAVAEPLAKKYVGKGALLLASMFGDSSSGRNAAVNDSRQLGNLASALASPLHVRMLKQGKTLDEIGILTQPLEDRLTSGLGEIRETLRDLGPPPQRGAAEQRCR